jgi:hypothetical protein
MRGGGRGIIIASSKGEERHNQRNAVIGSVVDRDLVQVKCHVKVHNNGDEMG